MRYEQAVKNFKVYYLDPGEYDYCKVQLMWSDYVDMLNREGEITDKQRDNWATPFRYGKTVVVYNRKVVEEK